jgi:DNA processing protein
VSACAACLRASALRSEGLTVAENKASSGLEVRRFLRMDPEEMSAVLRREHPGVEARLEESLPFAVDEAERRHGLWTVCRHEPEFPVALGQFREPSDVPSVIYGVGEKRMFDLRTDRGSVAVVGARRATAYGREVAYSLANEASAIGMTVISGMALGIDGAAHRGALQGGGRTIAVLAGGPEAAYPRSHRLLYDQIREVGCVISENPPGSEVRRWAFVARNRLIAGLAAITIFVEGATDSGAMHTVGFAEELGLAVGAVPGPVGSPMSAGPNALLAGLGGHLVRDLDDVLEALGLESDGPHPTVDAAAVTGELGEEIIGLICAGDRTPREIAAALPEVTGREVVRVLGRLELHGIVRREASGEYLLARTPGL